jgi:hypothetical protein
MTTDAVSKTECYTPLSEPLKSILHCITLRTLKLTPTVTLLPSIQEVPTVITIQIPINFNMLLYYPKDTVPHTVGQFLLDQVITAKGSVGADNAIMW